MRSCVALAQALVLVFANVAARADDAETASDLLRQGVVLRRQHRNLEALELFEKAQALGGGPIARAQAALAEQALGRWLEAERDLMTALLATNDAWITMNRVALVGAGNEIAGHLAWLTLTVEPPEAKAQLAGRSLATGIEERVEAGTAVVEVTAPGFSTSTPGVVASPGAHVAVTVTLAPLAKLPEERPPVQPTALDLPSAPPAKPRTTPASLVGPAVLGAGGLIAVGAGSYFGVRASDEKGQRDAQCSSSGCSAAAFTHDAAARSAAINASALFGSGAALLLGGASWWAASRLRGPRATERLTAGIVFGSLAIGDAAGGAALGLLAIHDKQERDAQCMGGECSPRALSYDAEARAAAGVSTVALAAAVGLGGVATWFFVGPRGEGHSSSALATVHVTFGPDGASASGTF
jgi:hypothetical protein